MILFVFFVLPIATILLSIVLQKILRSPILVAITFFSIYLIVIFVLFSGTLAEAIIATIIYTILAFITAYIVQAIQCIRRRLNQTDCALTNLLTNNGVANLNNALVTNSMIENSIAEAQNSNNLNLCGNCGWGSNRRCCRRR